MRTIVFSKDRPLQLDGFLRAYFRHCQDPEAAEVYILYACSQARQETSYARLQKRWPNVRFVREIVFKQQLLALAQGATHVLFCVDDSLFFRRFALREMVDLLDRYPRAVGFSLRLGQNTTVCYTVGKAQAVPDHTLVAPEVMCFDWTEAAYDFGYPLELSSSLYRCETILPLLANGPHGNPNTLETWLWRNLDGVRETRPQLLSYRRSAACSIPVNVVQDVYASRHEAGDGQTPEELLTAFEAGMVLDVAKLDGFVPEAAHQPLRLPLAPGGDEPAPAATPPRISVVIPCYDQGHFLGDAVASLAAQKNAPAEVIVVDDGSRDDSAAAARRLASEFPALHIRVIATENHGLAQARNTGIEQAAGDWILPLDADDMLSPGYLDEAVAAIRNAPWANLVFANVRQFGAGDQPWDPCDYRPDRIAHIDTFPYAAVYRKRLWELAGGYDPSLPWGAEDWNFWIRCSEYGIWPVRLAKAALRYRVHPGGGMYDRMMPHWPEVLACLKTLYPHRYPLSAVLRAHKRLGRTGAATRRIVAERAARFPTRPLPHFWLGLFAEAAGETATAEACFARAHALAAAEDWQPALRLGLSLQARGEGQAAEGWFEAALRCRPGLTRFLDRLARVRAMAATRRPAGPGPRLRTIAPGADDRGRTSDGPSETSGRAPVVSVFMPAYNAAKYLPDTIESLLGQTFSRFELLVADDGSEDRTRDIVREYAQRDARVRLLCLPHAGEVRARNAALGQVHPEAAYLLNHDSDDLSLPAKLEKLVAFLDGHPEIAAVGCLAEYFDDAGNPLGRPELDVAAASIRAHFGHRNSMVHSATLIRRGVFAALGGYREQYRSVDDYDLFARALLAGFHLANLPEVLHRIRLHPASVGTRQSERQARLAAEIGARFEAMCAPQTQRRLQTI